MIRLLVRSIALVMATGLTLATAPATATDALWRGTPYRVAVEVDLSASGLSNPQRGRLISAVENLLQGRVAPFWRAAVEIVGPNTESPPDAQPHDKRFRLSVIARGVGFRIEVSEHDGLLDHAGPTSVVDGAPASRLDEAALAALLDAFRPVARFQRIPERPGEYTLTYRAIDLAAESAIAVAREGTLLTPFAQRRGRGDQANAALPERVRWTYLIAAPAADESAPPSATVVSHTRRPFPRTARVGLLAIATPALAQSPARLVLRSVDDPETPLPGYDALLGRPGEGDLLRLPYSDERGLIRLPESDGVWMAHVRCGGLVVASVPVAPATGEDIVLPLTDERSRLRAELQMQSLREELIDTVARRKILRERIMRLLKAQRIEAAEKLVKELEALPTKKDFQKRLDRAQRTASASHPNAQKWLERLFTETEQQLSGALDPRELTALQREVDRAAQQSDLTGGETSTTS